MQDITGKEKVYTEVIVFYNVLKRKKIIPFVIYYYNNSDVIKIKYMPT